MDLSNEINSIVNGNVNGDFIYPPVKINKEIYAANMSLITLKMAQNKDKCHRLMLLLQDDFLNLVCDLSSLRIYNNAKYVLEPLPLNSRIKNQQGVFVFSNGLEEDVIDNDFLEDTNIINSYDGEALCKVDEDKGIVRVDIQGKYMREIHEELNLYGISKDFIYPELPFYTEVMQKRIVRETLGGKI